MMTNIATIFFAHTWFLARVSLMSPGEAYSACLAFLNRGSFTSCIQFHELITAKQGATHEEEPILSNVSMENVAMRTFPNLGLHFIESSTLWSIPRVSISRSSGASRRLVGRSGRRMGITLGIRCIYLPLQPFGKTTQIESSRLWGILRRFLASSSRSQ